MTNKEKEVVLVLFLFSLCSALLLAMIFVVMKISFKSADSSGDVAYYCPLENKKAMAQFVNKCADSHSEAFCYALAKGEFCRIVRRF